MNGRYFLFSTDFVYLGKYCEEFDKEEFREILEPLKIAPRSHRVRDLSRHPEIKRLLDLVFEKYQNMKNRHSEPIETRELSYSRCR